MIPVKTNKLKQLISNLISEIKVFDGNILSMFKRMPDFESLENINKIPVNGKEDGWFGTSKATVFSDRPISDFNINTPVLDIFVKRYANFR